MVMNWRMLPEVTNFMSTDPKLTLDDQIKWYDKISKDQNAYYFIIEYENIPIGYFSITNIDIANKHCFWSWYIANKDMREKKIGQNIMVTFFDLVFYKWRFNKVNTDVLSFNKRGKHLNLKFGAKIEGIFREHIFKNGEWVDMLRLAILKEEWDAIREHIKYPNITTVWTD